MAQCFKITSTMNAELFEIMPKFQILQDKREITFIISRNWKRLSLLNFPRADILEFMTYNSFPLLFGSRHGRGSDLFL